MALKKTNLGFSICSSGDKPRGGNDAEIAAARKLKRRMMQALLTGRIRFA